MNPIEKFNDPLPAEVEAEIQAVVDGYRTEYDERDYDYFEYMEGFGNEVEEIKRGTEEWEEAMREREDSFPLRASEWYDHLTGNRSALHAYPGWSFESFREAIREEISDILYDYALADVDPEEDWSDELGEMLNDIGGVLDIVTEDALADTVVSSVPSASDQ